MSRFFEAVREGDLLYLHKMIAKADLSATNEFGFTPLHAAALACENCDANTASTIITLLVDAGAPLEVTDRGGRTPLFLAAEFSNSLEPIKTLIDAGCNPHVYDSAGNHIVHNSNDPTIQAFLSEVTGVVPRQRLNLPSKRCTAAEWKVAKIEIDRVFSDLNHSGILSLHDIGTTQEDGFADASDLFREASTSPRGICFYSHQDLNRAKRTSHLPLSFWAAPEGENEPMRLLAEEIVERFRTAGFLVEWSGSPAIRPVIFVSELP